MAVKVLLEVNVKPDQVETMKSAMKNVLPETRTKDGCIDAELYNNKDEATNFVIIGTWESREHYEKYFAWRQERGDIDTLGALLSGPPSIRYFDLNPTS